MNGAKLEFRNAAKNYGDFTALQPTSIAIEPGEFFALLGPSGSGKSTLLGTVAGFVPLSDGDILLNSARIDGLPPYKRNIGMVFQNYSLFPFRTVAQNVAFPLELRGEPKSRISDLVTRMLEKVRLSHLGDRFPKQLSGGQQQRVALARAAIYDAPLLLMDEPLGALDKKLREEMQYEIKTFHREVGSTVLYVTHDQEEAASMADRMAIMNNGRLEQCGSPRELYDKPCNAFVANFLGEANIFHIDGSNHNCDGFAHTREGLAIRQTQSSVNEDNTVACIRPEQIRFSEAGEVGNNYSGVIVDVVYYAGYIRYRVQVTDQCIVSIRTPLTSGATARPVGTQVNIGWDEADTKFIPLQ